MPVNNAGLKTFSGRRASQNPFELGSFVQLMQDRGVKSYLEIGARDGDTFVHVMEILPVGSVGVAVDLPGGLWGKKSTRANLEKATAHLVKKGYKATCLFGDSKTDATKRLVKGRGPYDAMLIDGDHTLAGVTADFHAYHELAPLVAFHDIVGEGQFEKVYNNPVQVPYFWKQLKFQRSDLRFQEFVDQDSKMGIGVVIRD